MFSLRVFLNLSQQHTACKKAFFNTDVIAKKKKKDNERQTILLLNETEEVAAKTSFSERSEIEWKCNYSVKQNLPGETLREAGLDEVDV